MTYTVSGGMLNPTHLLLDNSTSPKQSNLDFLYKI